MMKAWKIGAIVLALSLLTGIFFAGYYAAQSSGYDRGDEASYNSGLNGGYALGFDAGYWEVGGDTDIDLLIYKMEYAKTIHEQYLKVPPYPQTGSHGWHQEWVDTYDKVIEVLEQVKHYQETYGVAEETMAE